MDRRARALECHCSHTIADLGGSDGCVVCMSFTPSPVVSPDGPNSKIHTWRPQLIINAGISGCGWGAAAVFLFPYHSSVHQVFVAFVLGGMAVGSAATLSSVLEAY